MNKDGRDFYVDEKGTEFPISKTYSHPCMLVTGDVQKDEYQQLAELVEKIDKDDFSKNTLSEYPKTVKEITIF